VQSFATWTKRSWSSYLHHGLSVTACSIVGRSVSNKLGTILTVLVSQLKKYYQGRNARIFMIWSNFEPISITSVVPHQHIPSFLIFVISSSFFHLSKSSHDIFILTTATETKICITVTTSACSHLQTTCKYTCFLDLDVMIQEKTFKRQELLSCWGITLENILLKMLIHEKTHLETFTLVYNHTCT
jgi:hypothetical protein